MYATNLRPSRNRNWQLLNSGEPLPKEKRIQVIRRHVLEEEYQIDRIISQKQCPDEKAVQNRLSSTISRITISFPTDVFRYIFGADVNNTLLCLEDFSELPLSSNWYFKLNCHGQGAKLNFPVRVKSVVREKTIFTLSDNKVVKKKVPSEKLQITSDTVFENEGKQFDEIRQRQQFRKLKTLTTFSEQALTFAETFGLKPLKIDLKPEKAILNDDINLSYNQLSTVAIVKSDENYENLKETCKPLFDQLNNLVKNKFVKINEKSYEIEFFVGGDMKFLQILLGLGSLVGDYACPWCKVHKNDRHDISKCWNFYRTPELFRSYEEICQLSCLPKNNFGVKHKPLLELSVNHYVPDELHLLLRISDILMRNLIFDSKDKDDKYKKETKCNGKNLEK
ncbi:unnamed protein product [Mytilus coruscus]|uniref:Uncharacterized protein n=1 Tax=Mytilus coruscus TaxID=42192 RepID=A0A6J8D612_MYTCO|nr:unnamed protein product [Mytilus coruscus]